MSTGTHQRVLAGVLEVEVMSVLTRIHSAMRSVAYWSTWFLLEAYGPAEQSDDGDPIQQLRRRYGKPITLSRIRRRR